MTQFMDSSNSIRSCFLLSTPIFQRLRSLKQLGGAYFVFPGASHNRFEHCIGTCYLAGRWIKDLRDRFTADKTAEEGSINLVNEKEIFLVEIAALCHDLGHGPFSHTFEDVFIKQQNLEFSHEEASGELLKMILTDRVREELELDQNEVNLICALISGEIPPNWPKEKNFLFQIVSNKATSIDVDKFDYLARDCYAANLGLVASKRDKCSFTSR